MNRCGDCDMCCYIPRIQALNKKPDTLCDNYCPMKKHCKIYKDRPSECSEFDCMWLQSGAHEDLRPDKCGVMFEKISDDLIYGTQDPRQEPSNLGMAQVDQFNKQNFSVVINYKGKKEIYEADGHTIENIKKQLESFIERKYGNS